MISVSLFKCVCSHSNIMFSGICVSCGDTMFCVVHLFRRGHVSLFMQLQLSAFLFVFCGFMRVPNDAALCFVIT